jgi:transcriptional regulator with XRE-family HTH domain
VISAAARDQATGEFGARVKEARQAKGWTQKRLSDESGIPLTMIRIYEQGRSYPEAPRLSMLCRLLGVKADWLIPTDIDEGSGR